MKDNLSEIRFMIYTVAAITVLMLIHIFHPQLTAMYNPIDYVSFHTLLEFFSISVSMTIFLYSWKTYNEKKSSRMLLLSFIFFTVGMVDLLHTMTFKGMPHFITESSVTKSTSLWVVARMLESTLMVTVLILPEVSLKRDYRRLVLTGAFMLIGAIAFIVFYFENSLPILVIEGQGTTPLKNGMEYFISFIHFMSLIISLYRYYLDKKIEYLYTALAFTFLFLSELIFTIYQSVFDLDNFSGHIFKVIGYYFILKGFYFTSNEKDHHPDEVKSEAAKNFREHQGAVFLLEKIENNFIISQIDGGLICEWGLKQGKLYGSSLHDLLPSYAGAVLDYCAECWEFEKKLSFTAEINKRFMLISLVPVVKNGAVSQISGVVTDISNFIHSNISPNEFKYFSEIELRVLPDRKTARIL